ncbi:hypothetical protein NDN08_006617 [Rhodosorus marinus]|uniref:Uncharacterized protein n=1 Tax=Rhodosorus marinus TaxID=101924 RepID=A0AAV8UIA8_9RHOD|nr:hypothetical protein NDN08_006617 [Rhodosorus marinus]
MEQTWTHEGFWSIGSFLGTDIEEIRSTLKQECRTHGSDITTAYSSRAKGLFVLKCSYSKGTDSKPNSVPKKTKKRTKKTADCSFEIRLTLIEGAAMSSLDNFGQSKRKISLRNMFRGSVPSPDGFRDGWYVMSRNSTHSGHPRMELNPNPTEVLPIELSSDDFARKWERLFHLASESQQKELLKQQSDFEHELAAAIGSSQSHQQPARASPSSMRLKRKEMPRNASRPRTLKNRTRRVVSSARKEGTDEPKDRTGH